MEGWGQGGREGGEGEREGWGGQGGREGRREGGKRMDHGPRHTCTCTCTCMPLNHWRRRDGFGEVGASDAIYPVISGSHTLVAISLTWF